MKTLALVERYIHLLFNTYELRTYFVRFFKSQSILKVIKMSTQYCFVDRYRVTEILIFLENITLAERFSAS